MTNEECVSRIKAGVDVSDNMLQLYQNMKGCIYKLAKRYSGYAELEDLAQEGYIALCKAVELYEPGKASFFSYAYKCIQGYMLRYVQNSGKLSADMWNHVRNYDRLCARFEMEYNRKPSVAEICHCLGIDNKLCHEVIKVAETEQNASLDGYISSEDGDTTLADTLASDEDIEESVLDGVMKEQMQEGLWKVVDSLPGKQSDMIRKRYIDNMTLNDIGIECNTTISRVRSGIQKGLRTLRSYRREELLSFLDDNIESLAYKGCGVDKFNHTWTSSTERAAFEDMNKHG